MIIREIEINDAESLVRIMKQVESESQYMLYESGERKTCPEQQEKRIAAMKKDGHSTILVAEDPAAGLIGYLFVIGSHVKRQKHTAYLVIGILNEYRGIGVGTKLFTQLEEWVATHNIHRLELSVATRNEPGLRLYKKMGFEIEGTKRASLFIDGEYVDEYYMSKLLSFF